MEADNDKELMKIRLETLKTMVGRLKNTSSSKGSSSSTAVVPPDRVRIRNSVENQSWQSTRHSKSLATAPTKYSVTTNKISAYPLSTNKFLSNVTSKSQPQTWNSSNSEEKPFSRKVPLSSKHKYVKPGFQSSTANDNRTIHVTRNKLIRIVTTQPLARLDHVSTVAQSNLSLPNEIFIKPSLKTTSNEESKRTSYKATPNATNILSKYSLVNPPSSANSSVTNVKKVAQTMTNVHLSPQLTDSSRKINLSTSSSFDRAHPLKQSKYKLVKTALASKNPSPHGEVAYKATARKWTKLDNNTVPPATPTAKTLQRSKPDSAGYTVIRRRYALIKNNKADDDTQQPLIRKPPFNASHKYAISSKYALKKKSFLTRRVSFLQNTTFKQTNFKDTRKVGKGNNNKLLLKRHGSNFIVSSNMKSLHKVKSTASKPTATLPTTVLRMSTTTPSVVPSVKRFKYQRTNSKTLRAPQSISAKRLVASKLVRRNLIMLQQRKKMNKTKYCLFYNRFGKCKRGDQCRFIHDPQKVAVCTKFIRGTCDDEKCLFSHKLEPSKMPVCSYFLFNKCTNDDCPYRHVNVNNDAVVCKDFLDGYCAEGDKCKKKHVIECPEFCETGKCANRKTCKMLHKLSRKRKRRRTISSSGTRKPRVFASHKLSELQERKEQVATLSPLRNNGRSHLLPNFINEKINEERYETSRGMSFSTIRNLFTMDGGVSDSSRDDEKAGTSGLISRRSEPMDDFIPLGMSSSDDDEDDVTEKMT